MKMKSILLLAVAMSCGLVAMLGVQQVLSGDKGPAPEMVRVLVARTDIPPGTPLDDTNTHFKELPREAVPEGAVTRPEEYEDRALMDGSAVPGEIIMLAKLGEKGVYGPSSEIPEGMRVVTVPVDLTKTHSGLIRPKDRVDVLVTYQARLSGEGPVSRTRTVLEYIKVFATDSLRSGVNRDANEIQAKNISLLVDPDQANLLMLAHKMGTLHLALRHKSDSQPANAVAYDDRIFQDVETGWGLGESEPSVAEAESVPADVRAALEQELERQGHGLADTSALAPAKPTWRVRIYSGSHVRTEELEIEEADFKEEPAAI